MHRVQVRPVLEHHAATEDDDLQLVCTGFREEVVESADEGPGVRAECQRGEAFENESVILPVYGFSRHY